MATDRCEGRSTAQVCGAQMFHILLVCWLTKLGDDHVFWILGSVDW